MIHIAKTGLAALAAGLVALPLAAGAQTAAQPAKPPAPAASKADAPKAAGITRQQYIDQAAKRFDTMDANKDGLLTQDESRAHARKAREEQTKRRDEMRDRRATTKPSGT
jgi:hypothetical protein